MGHTFIYHRGCINDQSEKLLKAQKIIRTLALMHDRKMVRMSSRDVRLKARKDFFYFKPELDIAVIEENMHTQGTTFDYEGLH